MIPWLVWIRKPFHLSIREGRGIFNFTISQFDTGWFFYIYILGFRWYNV